MQETRASCQHSSDSLIISNIHDEALLQWTIGTCTLYEGSEAFSRLLKKKGWAMLEMLMTFQKGF